TRSDGALLTVTWLSRENFWPCSMSVRCRTESVPRTSECPDRVAPGRQRLVPPVTDQATRLKLHPDAQQRASPAPQRWSKGSAYRLFSFRRRPICLLHLR